MMKVPLPLSHAISSIRWSLSTPSSPMYYEPIQSLKTLRHPQNIPPELVPIFSRGIHETIHDLTLSSSDESVDRTYKKHNVMLALALILLGNGFMDEAHDLITPLSWSEDTYFGGPTMIHEAEDSVVMIASYSHSLLHRREGYAQGEFGMIGYQNANFWSNAAQSRRRSLDEARSTSVLEDEEFFYLSRKVKEEIIHLSKQHGPEAQLWCDKMMSITRQGAGFIDEDDMIWVPRSLHDLAASVSKGHSISMDMLRFAECACELELRILLDCCLQRAGYDIDCYSHESLELDTILAQRVANRVSAAHIDAFQSSSSVIVRRVILESLSLDEESTNKSYISAASGLACRLLGCSAVKYVGEGNQNDGNNSLYVFLPRKEESEIALETIDAWTTQLLGSSLIYGGGSLMVGDALCFRMDENQVSFPENIKGLYRFLPTEPSDKNTVFIDKYYGSRGDSPTSVLQWSKGTIHKSIYP